LPRCKLPVGCMPEKTRGMKAVIWEILWTELGRLMPAIARLEKT
jgi:hypothetical protein